MLLRCSGGWVLSPEVVRQLVTISKAPRVTLMCSEVGEAGTQSFASGSQLWHNPSIPGRDSQSVSLLEQLLVG